MRRRAILILAVVVAATLMAGGAANHLALAQSNNEATTPKTQGTTPSTTTSSLPDNSSVGTSAAAFSAPTAWGNNESGQLGNNSTTSSPVPVQVSNLSASEVKQVSAGWHSMALKNDGTVWAWGNNWFGALGNDSPAKSYVPIQVVDSNGTPLSGVTSISAGISSLALKSDGTVWAWGDNFRGQLGDGTYTSSPVPVQVMDSNGTPLSGVKAIAAGQWHSLALKSNGTVWAWGDNWFGQLGNKSNTTPHVAVQVSNLKRVKAISGGEAHNLALEKTKKGNIVMAWGYNRYGQLGNDSTQLSPVPVRVSNLKGATAIFSGSTANHSLALKSNGTVWAWGDNRYGQLGNGTTSTAGCYCSTTPVSVSNLIGVTTLAAGEWHSVAN
jgi:alpha-tubulin suppressor-like RCC1 family protein